MLGARRSGTTWLHELLLAHPDVVGVAAAVNRPGELNPRETVVMSALDECWKNAHRSDGEGLPAYLSHDEIVAYLRRFCDSLFARARHRYNHDASWFAEKSPSTVWRLPQLIAIYPDAWFISIVRDGRDVARSLADAPMPPHTVAEAAAEWVKSLDFIEASRHRMARFREVRYEAMLSDPVGGIAELFEWLGLERNDDVLHGVEERAKVEVARFSEAGPVGSGKWMKLPARERATILDIAGDWLADLGYVDSPSG